MECRLPNRYLCIRSSAFERRSKGVRKVNSSVCVTDDGHYQLSLLWQNDETRLPNNIAMAQRRLASLKKRLLKDPSLKEKYVSAINAYLAKGHAKQISEDQESEITWYLPHHPVVHPHQSKIRVVFDCAAEYHNTSLNQKLVRGPDLMNNLIDVLTKFRKEPIALVRDVEQMFHQVYVNPEHREALRFLWWPDGNLLMNRRLIKCWCIFLAPNHRYVALIFAFARQRMNLGIYIHLRYPK